MRVKLTAKTIACSSAGDKATNRFGHLADEGDGNSPSAVTVGRQRIKACLPVALQKVVQVFGFDEFHRPPGPFCGVQQQVGVFGEDLDIGGSPDDN